MSCTHRLAVCFTAEIITCSSALKCTSFMAPSFDELLKVTLAEFLDLNLWLEHACRLHAASLVCWRLKNRTMSKNIISFSKEAYKRGILVCAVKRCLQISPCIFFPWPARFLEAGRLIFKNDLDSPLLALQVHAGQPSKANNSPSTRSQKHRDVRRPDLPLMPCSSMCA